MIDEGTVYLIHFDKPIAHASHYIGWAANVDARLWHHKHNRGARILKRANELGISYAIVRTWPGTRELERKLKNQKKARIYCPVCKKEHDKDKH